MRARRFVPLMAAALLVVPAMPASAHIDFFEIVNVDDDDTLGDNEWVYFGVDGFIDCAEGEKFLVTAKVIDDDFIGKGRTKGTCTGEGPQVWTVSLQEAPGSGFGDGCWERVSAKAHTKINGVPHDEERDTLPSHC